MRPDLGPLRLQVSVDYFSELIRRRLVVMLLEEYLGHAIMRHRAGLLRIESLLIFLQRLGELTHLRKLLAPADGYFHPHLRTHPQYFVARIDRDFLRLAERNHGELGRRSHHFDALVLGMP